MTGRYGNRNGNGNRNRGRKPLGLLLVAFCLPNPHPATLSPDPNVLALTAAQWQSRGADGTTITFGSESPHGATVRLAADQPGHGRAELVWSGRLSSLSPLSPMRGTIQGVYRTDRLNALGALVSAAGREFHLEPSLSWRYFELPVRGPAGSGAPELVLGLERHAVGSVSFTNVSFSGQERQGLVACGAARSFMRADPPLALAPGPVIRLEQTATGWWFVSPGGHGSFALGPDEAPWGWTTLVSAYTGRERDPHDPLFVDAYRAQTAQLAQRAQASGRAALMAGTFADWAFDFEELGRLLWAPASAKAVVARLKARHFSIEGVNRAWRTAFASFDELVARKPDPLTATGAMGRELGELARDWAARYVSMSIQAVRDADPGRLVFSPVLKLGPGLLAALPYLDLFGSYDAVAVSFEAASWQAGLAPEERGALELVAAVTGRPIVVTQLRLAEFGGTAPARAEQADRVVIDLHDLPFVAGVQWASLSGFNTRFRQPDPDPSAPAPAVASAAASAAKASADTNTDDGHWVVTSPSRNGR